MPELPQHHAVLLAAGASRRLGQPKQLLQLDGVALIRRMALAALATAPQQLLVALGAEAAGCSAALAGLPLRILVCARWREGMGATLAEAVTAAPSASAGLLILGVDQPALDASHLQALLGHWRLDPTQPVASGYAGTLGTPAVFPADWHTRLSQLSGDHGARALLRLHQPQPAAVIAPQLALDIDDAHDWRFVQSQMPTRRLTDET